MKKYLTFDIGGTAIKYAVMDSALKTGFRGHVPTPLDSIENLKSVISDICDQCRFSLAGEEIAGIAMSMPGVIDSNRGFAHSGGSLRYNDNRDIAWLLRDISQISQVVIENDAKCAAFAELRFGNLKGIKNAIVILLGTGIGGAVVINGEVFKGTHLSAGEFSYVRTDDRDKDLLNTWWFKTNGAFALNSAAAEALQLNLEAVDGRLVFRKLHEGSPEIQQVLRKFTDDLAIQMWNLQSILDPELFLIGGGISVQDVLFDYLNKSLTELFDKAPQISPIHRIQVKRCHFHNDSNLIGALSRFLDFYPENE